MNWRAVRAIYGFEMQRALRSKSIVSAAVFGTASSSPIVFKYSGVTESAIASPIAS